MAYDPKIQAEAAARIISREIGWAQASSEYGVSKATLSAWVRKAKAELTKALENDPDAPEAPKLTVIEGEGKGERSPRKSEPNKANRTAGVEAGAAGEGESEPSEKRTAILEKRTELLGQLESMTPAERKAVFSRYVIGFLLISLEMNTSIAQTCSDPEFIREDPRGVNELAGAVNGRADMLADLIQSGSTPGERIDPAV